MTKIEDDDYCTIGHLTWEGGLAWAGMKRSSIERLMINKVQMNFYRLVLCSCIT